MKIAPSTPTVSIAATISSPPTFLVSSTRFATPNDYTPRSAISALCSSRIDTPGPRSNQQLDPVDPEGRTSEGGQAPTQEHSQPWVVSVDVPISPANSGHTTIFAWSVPAGLD